VSLDLRALPIRSDLELGGGQSSTNYRIEIGAQDYEARSIS